VTDESSALKLVCEVGDEQFAEQVVQWARGAGRIDIADQVGGVLKDVKDRLAALSALGKDESVVEDASEVAKILTESPWVSPSFFNAIADLPEGAAKSELVITVLEHFSSYGAQIKPFISLAVQLEDLSRLVKAFGTNPRLAIRGVLEAWRQNNKALAYGLIPAALDIYHASKLNRLVQRINDLGFSRAVVKKLCERKDMALMGALSPRLIESLGVAEFIGRALEYATDKGALALVKSINRPEFTQQVRKWARHYGHRDIVKILDEAFPGGGG
jgi:hypothetical protein